MIYGYARVSTHAQAKDGNSLQAQAEQLKAEGAEKIFSDEYTGTKSDRPEFQKLLGELKSGDTLVVTKLDRFARNVTDGNELIKQLVERGVTVKVIGIGTIDDTPIGKMISNIFLAIAEFERAMILERTREGKKIAKKRPDFREGRPEKYSRAQIKHALDLLKNNSYSEVEKMTGISRATLVRYKKKYGGNECEKGESFESGKGS